MQVEKEFEALARSFVESSQRARAKAQTQSARLLSIILTGSQEQVDEFANELERELYEILEGSGKDSAAGGTDSGEGSPGDSQGNAEESGSGIGGGETQPVG